MTSWGRHDFIEQLRPPRGEGLGRARAPPFCPSTRPRVPADLEEIRSRLSLPDSFLFYPAQPWPHKNHELLLEALALVRERTGTTIPLVCSGAPPGHFHQVRDRAIELGFATTTIFPGFVSPKELRGLYELATALVFPSRFEGWGLPVCEAFSAGLPVASSSATGLPDLVGDAGLIFDPDEHRADGRCGGANLDGREAADATSPSAGGSAVSSSAGTARPACSAPTTGESAGRALQRKTVSFWRLRLPPERRPFADVDTGSDKGAVSALQRAIVAVLAAVRRALGSRLPDRLPRPAPAHRPADRAARLRVGRGRDPSGQRGARPRSAARRDRAGAGRPSRADGAPGALVRRGRRARRGPTARRLKMGLDPGSVWLDARGTQSVGHAERGIARYVTEHARALLELSPETIGGVGLSPDFPVPPIAEPLRESGKSAWQTQGAWPRRRSPADLPRHVALRGRARPGGDLADRGAAARGWWSPSTT